MASQELELWLSRAVNCSTSNFGTRGWLRFETADVYMRVGQVALDARNRVFAVTIANMGINQVHMQRKGTFKRLVGVIRKITRERIVVENVLQQPFAEALKRHGFVEVIRGIVNDDLPTLMLPLEQDWKP